MNAPSVETADRILFANLIMMLSSSVMQQLGKLVNPMTGKAEQHLESAQITIDMIEMLQRRTQGNLAKEEEKMIKDLLSDLQLNYVETAAAAARTKAPAAATPAPDAPVQPASNKDAKDPKFHKSYGEPAPSDRPADPGKQS